VLPLVSRSRHQSFTAQPRPPAGVAATAVRCWRTAGRRTLLVREALLATLEQRLILRRPATLAPAARLPLRNLERSIIGR